MSLVVPGEIRSSLPTACRGTETEPCYKDVTKNDTRVDRFRNPNGGSRDQEEKEGQEEFQKRPFLAEGRQAPGSDFPKSPRRRRGRRDPRRRGFGLEGFQQGASARGKSGEGPRRSRPARRQERQCTVAASARRRPPEPRNDCGE